MSALGTQKLCAVRGRVRSAPSRSRQRASTSGRLFLRCSSAVSVSAETLTPEEHAKNNLPDVLTRWAARNDAERGRPRTAQSFCVAKADIAAQGYDLSLNRYKEVVHEEVAHRAPKEILAELAKIEANIERETRQLEDLLK